MKSILHVFNHITAAKTQVDFLEQFIELVLSNSQLNNQYEHFFYVRTVPDFLTELQSINNASIEFFLNCTNLNNEFIARHTYYNLVIFHQFPNDELVKTIYHNLNILRKCYWYTWGGDYCQANIACMDNEFERSYKKFFINNLKGIICWNKFDYERIIRNYGVFTEFKKANYYPKFLIEDIEPVEINIQKKRINILVGNNAQLSNDHLTILRSLEKFKEEDINIYCPLSYGVQDSDYVNKVINIGKDIFGDKFIPLINFIAYIEYFEFLKRIDIAIFNQIRQQAGTNILFLLLFGKKVFFNEDGIIFNYYDEMNCKIFKTKDIVNYNFNKLKKFSKKDGKVNNSILHNIFSYPTLVAEWEEIFKS